MLEFATIICCLFLQINVRIRVLWIFDVVFSVIVKNKIIKQSVVVYFNI